ncbi:hypothetical protein R6Q59_035429, partial [Mikania micrantha]
VNFSRMLGALDIGYEATAGRRGKKAAGRRGKKAATGRRNRQRKKEKIIEQQEPDQQQQVDWIRQEARKSKTSCS